MHKWEVATFQTLKLLLILSTLKVGGQKKPQHYSEPKYNKTNRERFNVLHMSDAHIQFTYEQGTEAKCSQLVCGLTKSFNKN